MVSGFDGTKPVPNSKAVSEEIRTNFLALFSNNADTNPPSNPLDGTLWLDTSDVNNVKLKIYYGGVWKELFTNLQATPQTPIQSATFVQSFNDATTVVVVHNLNRFPSVTVVDASESVFMPDTIVYDNANQLTITFETPQTGKVYLN